MMKKKHKPEDEVSKNETTEDSENKDNITDSKDQSDATVTAEQASGQAQTEEKKDSGATASTDKLEQDLKETMSKLAELQDKYIRLSAEFDNYRKRTLKEKMDLSKYASEDLLLKVIPFMDDFERAMKHMEDATDCAAMKSGIDLIYVKFNEFLKQNGVKEVEAMNCDFNVDVHEAVAKVPVEEQEKKGKIVDVVLKGYFLQDKVIRFSKVVVGE
jgi:molecular chaperone GrpE